jgi:hypothetical protein
MMADIPGSILNQDCKYQVRPGAEITVRIVHPGLPDDGEKTHATLLDLSPQGAKIEVNQLIPVNESVTLEIACPEVCCTIMVAGAVCWCSSVTNGRLVLGCRFDPRIPDQQLEAFVAQGVLERRQYQREGVSLMLRARWEFCPEAEEAELVNVSVGGLCLHSLASHTPGSRVLLQYVGECEDSEAGVAVKAKILWQMETEEGFVTGCELIDQRNYKTLKHWQELGMKPGGRSLWSRLFRG